MKTKRQSAKISNAAPEPGKRVWMDNVHSQSNRNERWVWDQAMCAVSASRFLSVPAWLTVWIVPHSMNAVLAIGRYSILHSDRSYSGNKRKHYHRNKLEGGGGTAIRKERTMTGTSSRDLFTQIAFRRPLFTTILCAIHSHQRTRTHTYHTHTIQTTARTSSTKTIRRKTMKDETTEEMKQANIAIRISNFGNQQTL